MMKKLLLMLMAAVLLLCGAAMAEEPFTFRDGLKWGMSPDEVQAVDGEFVYEYSFGGTDMAVIEEGEHLGLSLDMRYLFIGDQLCCFAVDATMVDQVASLRDAATAAYGEPTNEAVPYLVNKYLTNYGLTPTATWMPAEDVYVAMIELGYDMTSLYYFDTDVDFWAAESGEEPETAPVETETADDDIDNLETDAYYLVQALTILTHKLEDASMLVTQTVTETGIISNEIMMSETEVAAGVYIDYTYEASFGVDLSKTTIEIKDSKIIMHLPEMIFYDSIRMDAIERKTGASTWIQHSDEEVQALLDARKVECRNSYLTGDYLVELRAASERAVDKTIAEWIKEIDSGITIEYRWPDQAE